MQLPPQGPKVATTTADLKKGVGSYATAVVAPKEGPINVSPGTPVVLIAKRLRESPTFKKLWRAIYLAWGAFWAYVLTNVLIAGGPFMLVDDQWTKLLKDAAYPALLTVAGVYGISLKVKDNDPVINGSLTSGTGK